MKGISIKKQEIITVISSISESLSVSDKHEFIVETALDTLSETLGIHCSWIQLAGQSGTNPYLASHRNFTEDMLHDLTHMNKEHPLFQEVLGLGNRIVIPNLSLDGAYGMTVFEKAGFYSLVAVPITTYKVIGILGAADRKKRRFGNDIAQLLAVIASLVGVSLTKTIIMQKELPEKTGSSVSPGPVIDIDVRPDEVNNTILKQEPGPRVRNNTDEKLDAFGKHVRSMGKFRQQHN